METDFDKVKSEKIKEATDFFEKFGIEPIDSKEDYLSELPIFSENSNPKKEESKFHWTRLSINSNIGCVVD